jgi:hypothetical protein
VSKERGLWGRGGPPELKGGKKDRSRGATGGYCGNVVSWLAAALGVVEVRSYIDRCSVSLVIFRISTWLSIKPGLVAYIVRFNEPINHAGETGCWGTLPRLTAKAPKLPPAAQGRLG